MAKSGVLDGGDALDDESKNAFMNELKKRVAAVSSYYNKNKNENKKKVDALKESFEAVLHTCEKVDNESLKEEVKKQFNILEHSEKSTQDRSSGGHGANSELPK